VKRARRDFVQCIVQRNRESLALGFSAGIAFCLDVERAETAARAERCSREFSVLLNKLDKVFSEFGALGFDRIAVVRFLIAVSNALQRFSPAIFVVIVSCAFNHCCGKFARLKSAIWLVVRFQECAAAPNTG